MQRNNPNCRGSPLRNSTGGLNLLQPVVETATFEFHGSAHAIEEAVNPRGLPLVQRNHVAFSCELALNIFVLGQVAYIKVELDLFILDFGYRPFET